MSWILFQFDKDDRQQPLIHTCPSLSLLESLPNVFQRHLRPSPDSLSPSSHSPAASLSSVVPSRPSAGPPYLPTGSPRSVSIHQQLCSSSGSSFLPQSRVSCPCDPLTDLPLALLLNSYFTALVLCPLCGTNIGATILLVEILRDPNFHRAPHVVADPRILTGAIFSTAMASNLGAFSWTFSSSLAGLLWVSILRQKGIVVKGTEFAKWNCLFLPVLSTVASGVVLFQCYYF